MFTPHRTWTGLLTISLGASLACSPAEEVRVPLDPDPAAEIAITNFTVYDGVMGSKEVMVYLKIDRTIDRVELLCDDQAEPAASAQGPATTVQWDSSHCADGVVQIKARAVDEDDNAYLSAAVPVVVVNHGRVAALTEGTSGSIRIPANYTGTEEVDVKHHWDNPPAQTRVVAIAAWHIAEGEADWFIEGTLGCGVCPHSGSVWGQPEETTASPLVIDLHASDLGQTWLDTQQAFFHLRPLDAADHIGESLPYSIAIYLFE